MGRSHRHRVRLMQWDTARRNRGGGFQWRWETRSRRGELDGWNGIDLAAAVGPCPLRILPAQPFKAAERLRTSPTNAASFRSSRLISTLASAPVSAAWARAGHGEVQGHLRIRNGLERFGDARHFPGPLGHAQGHVGRALESFGNRAIARGLGFVGLHDGFIGRGVGVDGGLQFLAQRAQSRDGVAQLALVLQVILLAARMPATMSPAPRPWRRQPPQRCRRRAWPWARRVARQRARPRRAVRPPPSCRP